MWTRDGSGRKKGPRWLPLGTHLNTQPGSGIWALLYHVNLSVFSSVSGNYKTVMVNVRNK